MDLVRADTGTALTIQKYGPSGFVIAETTFEQAIILSPEQALPWDFNAEVAGAGAEAFADLVEACAKAEVVLLGCGARQIRPSKDVRDAFQSQGLTLEAMDTGAACRTYNVLVAEGRAVVAALIPAK